jgi:hypothetical protein
MSGSRKFIFQFVLGLAIVLFGGWVLGGIFNLVGLISPQVVSTIDCPAGSTAKVDWVQRSYDQPGQKSMTVTCHDASGSPVTPLTDAQSQALEYKYFFPAGALTMAVVVAAWFVGSAIQQRKAGQAGV